MRRRGGGTACLEVHNVQKTQKAQVIQDLGALHRAVTASPVPGLIRPRAGGAGPDIDTLGGIKTDLPVVESLDQQSLPAALRLGGGGGAVDPAEWCLAVAELPADAEKARHDDHAAKGMGLDLAAVDGAFESVEKSDALDTVHAQVLLQLAHRVGVGGHPQRVVTGEGEQYLVRKDFRVVTETYGVRHIEDEGTKDNPVDRLGRGPTIPPHAGLAARAEQTTMKHAIAGRLRAGGLVLGATDQGTAAA